MEGWIKLHRGLLENDLWKSEAFTRGQAWVDLLLLANHKDSFFYKRGNKVNVKRGQLGRSSVELSDRWKWSRSKVSKFLKDLEKEQQIILHKSNVTQLITIVNYNVYQEKEQQTAQQKNSRRTAEEQQKNTYKNVKKEKNVKNKENKTKGKVRDKIPPAPYFQNQKENLGAKNKSSESKKIPPKKVLSTTGEQENTPDIKLPAGFTKPPRAWYQDQLDELAEERGAMPKGTFAQSFKSKRIENWSEELKSGFVNWIFYLAARTRHGYQSQSANVQASKFNEFLKTGTERDLLEVWEYCIEKGTWTDWEKALKKIKDEQQTNNKQQSAFGNNSTQQQSRFGQLGKSFQANGR